MGRGKEGRVKMMDLITSKVLSKDEGKNTFLLHEDEEETMK